MRAKSLFHWAATAWLVAATTLLAAGIARSQDSPRHPNRQQDDSVSQSLADLRAQVKQLESILVDMRTELAGSRAEVSEIRREIDAMRLQLASAQGAPQALASNAGPTEAPPASEGDQVESSAAQTTEERLAKIEEDQRLLNSKVDEQYQTKLESASKYRVRLSGIVLFNAFGNKGTVDNEDFPDIAVSRGPLDSRRDVGATLRQSELGLELFGPEVMGAKTSANLQFDFSGGFSDALNGVTFGLIRLRTGTVRFDWARTSLIAGQDALFLSPLSPTSLASLAIPAFSYAGNLWSWTPQIRVERRLDLSNDSTITVQAGILDPLTGEPPDSQFLRFSPQSEPLFVRSGQAGEQSGQPAYAGRVGWSERVSGETFQVGLGGYYSRQNWGFGRNIDSWAGMADWGVPLSHWFGLAGEFYTGRALGGLSAGIGRSVLFEGPLTDPSTIVRGLRSMGGWSQLKFTPTEKLEFNGAFGQDNPFAADVRSFPDSPSYFNPLIVRNRSTMANFIYRPRSDLLVSLEYRHLRTFLLNNDSLTANHITLSAGFLF